MPGIGVGDGGGGWAIKQDGMTPLTRKDTEQKLNAAGKEERREGEGGGGGERVIQR